VTDNDVESSKPTLSGRRAGDHRGTEMMIEQPSERSRSGDGRPALFRKFVGAVAGWIVLILVVLFAMDRWSIELYFMLSFQGLLAVRVMLAPTDRVPDWWRVLDYLVYAGFLLFGYFVVRRTGLLAV